MMIEAADAIVSKNRTVPGKASPVSLCVRTSVPHTIFLFIFKILSPPPFMLMCLNFGDGMDARTSATALSALMKAGKAAGTVLGSIPPGIWSTRGS